MSPVQKEIAALEERLRLAELGPDPKFYEEALADDAVRRPSVHRHSEVHARVVEEARSLADRRGINLELSAFAQPRVSATGRIRSPRGPQLQPLAV